MIVAGHQPNYLPYPGFFHKMMRVDIFVIADNVQFVKRGPFGWIHRNQIRTRDGTQWLTVPVLTKGKFDQKICDASIDNKKSWRREHWRAIEINYSKAPYFKIYADSISSVYQREWEMLSLLSTEFIRALAATLHIETPVKIASSLKVSGESTDYVIDICRKTGGTKYLSGKHGRDYLDASGFSAAGIELEFQEFTCPTYKQIDYPDFIPNLSIIDMLFNCGPETRDLLLK